MTGNKQPLSLFRTTLTIDHKAIKPADLIKKLSDIGLHVQEMTVTPIHLDNTLTLEGTFWPRNIHTHKHTPENK